MVRPFTSKLIKTLNLAKEKVWFNEENWFHFFTGEFISQTGIYTFYGSMRDMNVFAKAGAIIPMATHHNQGVSNFPSELDIHIFPLSNNIFTLIEDNESEIIKTTIQLINTKNNLKVIISSETLNYIQRDLHIHFRSVNLSSIIKVSCEHSVKRIKQNNTIKVTLKYNMKNTIEITLVNTLPVCKNPYSLNKDILKAISLSSLKTKEKNSIGYIDYNKPHESRGWLANSKTLSEKIKGIKNLPIPKNVKIYLKEIVKKAIKNANSY